MFLLDVISPIAIGLGYLVIAFAIALIVSILILIWKIC